MNEVFKTDIINGELINWEKLSIEEINEIKTTAEKNEQKIIDKILNMFSKITEE